jgi:hypothetical protein
MVFWTTLDELEFVDSLAMEGDRQVLRNYLAAAKVRRWDPAIDSKRVIEAAEEALRTLPEVNT